MRAVLLSLLVRWILLGWLALVGDALRGQVILDPTQRIPLPEGHSFLISVHLGPSSFPGTERLYLFTTDEVYDSAFPAVSSNPWTKIASLRQLVRPQQASVVQFIDPGRWLFASYDADDRPALFTVSQSPLGVRGISQLGIVDLPRAMTAPTPDGRLYMIADAPGLEVQRRDANNDYALHPGFSAPLAGNFVPFISLGPDNRVYVLQEGQLAGDFSRFLRLDPDTGATLSTFSVGGPARAFAMNSDGLAFVVYQHDVDWGNIYDAPTGTPLGRFNHQLRTDINDPKSLGGRLSLYASNLAFAAVSGTGANVEVFDISGLYGAGAIFSTGGTAHTQATISSADNFTIADTGGSLQLTGASTLPGIATVSAGTTLELAGTASLGALAVRTIDSGTLLLRGDAGSRSVLEVRIVGTGRLRFDGGILRAPGDTGLTAVTIDGGGAFIDTNGYAVFSSHAIDGTGGLTKQGAGTLTLSGPNTYSGGTTISGGKLEVSANENLGAASGAIVLAGGTLAATSSFSAARATTLDVNGGSFDVITGATLTWNGAVGGSGALTKLGDGRLNLTGTNTYLGPTVVSSGALFVTGSLGGSGVTVNSGATLGGTGTVDAATAIASGGQLAPGSSPGTTTFTSGLTLASGSILNFELGSLSDQIRVSGGTLTGPSGIDGITLNLSNSGGFVAGTYTLFDFTGASTSGFDVSDFSFGSTIAGFDYSLAFVGSTVALTATTSAIPEPSTYAAISGVVAFALAALRRRRPVAKS